MDIPAFYPTLQQAWRLKWTIAPYILANIVLIAVIMYRLLKSKDISDDTKKTLSYIELAFSFAGSFPVLILFCLFSLMILMGFLLHRSGFPYIKQLYLFLFYFSIFTLVNPFSLTGLRLMLKDKLSEQQHNIISSLTIPVALLISYLTVLVFNGYFLD